MLRAALLRAALLRAAKGAPAELRIDLAAEGESITCGVRDGNAAYHAVLTWIAGGPNGPVARHAALGRIAVALAALRHGRTAGDPDPGESDASESGASTVSARS